MIELITSSKSARDLSLAILCLVIGAVCFAVYKLALRLFCQGKDSWLAEKGFLWFWFGTLAFAVAAIVFFLLFAIASYCGCDELQQAYILFEKASFS